MAGACLSYDRARVLLCFLLFATIVVLYPEADLEFSPGPEPIPARLVLQNTAERSFAAYLDESKRDNSSPAGEQDEDGEEAVVLMAVITTVNKRYIEEWRSFRVALSQDKDNKLAMESGRIVVRYFVGGQGLDGEGQKTLAALQRKHDDIVVLDCGDTYDDLTAKSLEMIRYSARHMPNVKLTWKIDIDAYPAPGGLLRQLDTWQTVRPGVDVNWLYWGTVQGGTAVFRRHKKWGVSKEQYPNETLPYYMDGSQGYLLGRNAVRRIAALSVAELKSLHKYIRLEDVSVGMWVAHINSMLADFRLQDSRVTRGLCCAHDDSTEALGANDGPIVWVDFDKTQKDVCSERCDYCPKYCEPCPCKIADSRDCLVYPPTRIRRMARCMFRRHSFERCCQG